MANETWTAIATLTGVATARDLGEALERLPDPAPTGVGTFEIDEDADLWEVGAYFVEKPDETALAVLSAAFGASGFAVSKVPNEDWVSKVRRELTPVRAGRFVLHGGHDHGDAPPSAIRMQIEAAMAFGTGHHGTTRGCLLSIDALARRGLSARRALDLGTGTGALAMAAAKLWRTQAVATDIDPVAVMTARENVKFNGAAGLVRVIRAKGAFEPPTLERAPYDLVLANILAAPLKRLAPQIGRVAAPGARVILSGILNRQARSVENVFAGHRMAVERRLRLGEWTTLTLVRW